MSRITLLVVLSLSLVFQAGIASARDWHVDDTGTDPASGCGGATDLGSAYRTIQKAVDCMQPGDTVLVHNGVYGGWGACRPSNPSACIGNPQIGALVHLVGMRKTGSSASSRFTIKAAPGEKPVLDAVSVPSEPLDTAFFVDNTQFVTIDGFTIRRFSATSQISVPAARKCYGTIVFSQGSADGQILNNNISQTDPAFTADVDAADIVLCNTPARIRVNRNIITTQLRAAIYYSGPSGAALTTNGEISDNYIEQTLDVGNPKGLLRSVGAVRNNGVRFMNNYIVNTAQNKSDQSVAIYIRDNSDIEIKGNVFSGYGTGMIVQDECCEPGVSPVNEEERHIISNNIFHGTKAAGNTYGMNNDGPAGSCDGCRFYNNIFMNFAKGIEILRPGTDPWPSFTAIGNNIMYNVSQPNVTSTDTIVEPTNGFNAALPIQNSGAPKPAALSWLARTIGMSTPSTPYYELFNTPSPSQAINFGSNAYCPWTPNDGQCDTGAYEFSGAAGLPTCAQLGGTPCSLGQACSGGNFQSSRDAGNLCCVGGTCTSVCVPAAEVCNGIDDDCDGQIDEGLSNTATCGVGACFMSVSQTCVSGSFIPACTPGSPSTETCNGVDDDCNGLADDGIICACTDNDLDGYNVTSSGCGPVDCDDANLTINPGALEVCNLADDNCDGNVNEGGVCPAARYNINTSYYDGITTNFSNLASFNAVQNVILEKAGRGKIEFQQPVTFTRDLDIDLHSRIDTNLARIDSSQLSELSVPARITLTGLTFSNPRILRDGSPCSSSICTFESYSGGMLVFTVTGFTS
ncbi:MAG: hypothetical protein HY518_03695, partial [Candidatus Aenigmarchaeota archaeon]|nr:hypothetical protein [Candidatus Aenigmarchaeota archaeon]